MRLIVALELLLLETLEFFVTSSTEVSSPSSWWVKPLLERGDRNKELLKVFILVCGVVSEDSLDLERREGVVAE